MSDALATFCNATADEVSEAVCTVDKELASTKTGINVFFLLFGGALVFMMQAGFAMLCAGSVRQKNAKNIMLKNLLDACGGAIGFYLFGYTVAYGGDQGDDTTYIGSGKLALQGFDGDFSFFFFQFAFAATAATIVAGTVAERCKMSAYLCYSVFLSSFVYPVVAHAVWDDNGYFSAFHADPDELLRGVGVVDFAGSGVVHMTGGLTALIAAAILGPRKGRFYDENGNPLEKAHSFPPHSVSLQILGTFILWFGWYGFNPGSTLVIDSEGAGGIAAICAVTTTLAAASGCVSAMFLDSIIDSLSTGETSYDLTMAMNGALGGLVAITAGTSVITPHHSILVGAIGGLVYLVFSKFLVMIKIDDAVDAIPVHFANGFWGVVAVGLFADKDLMGAAYESDKCGIFMGCNADLFINEVFMLGAIIVWVSVTMTPFFVILNCFGMFRVDSLEEDVGLDISHHRGAAYDLSAPKKEDLDEYNASRHGRVEAPQEVVRVAKRTEEPSTVYLQEEEAA